MRARLEAEAGPDLAALLPSGYQRLGTVLLLRMPEALRPQFAFVGENFRERLGVASVLNWSGPVQGESRHPSLERVAGSETETEVREYGIRYALDAEKLLFARGNRTERRRAGLLTRPGDVVVDLFAGIGYFALPAAVVGRAARVVAVEQNPVAVHYLEQNVRLNRVVDRVEPVFGDNRVVSLPRAAADRAFLGYLPSAVPWIGSAIDLLRPSGGWLHVHLVADSREAVSVAEGQVFREIRRARRPVRSVRGREVKPYGPGRTHVVVDAEVGEGPPSPRRSLR